MTGVSPPRLVTAMTRWCHVAPGPRRAASTGNISPPRGVSTANGPAPHHGRPTSGGSTMRSIRHAGGALIAGLLLVAVTAAPALACGGLIGPNGAVNLL